MSKVRTFIAVELPFEVIGELCRLQDKLRSNGARVRWVKKDNLHLTMKFLGDVDYEETDPISRFIEESVSDISPFLVRVNGTGTFPKGGRTPRIVWAGIKGDIEPLEHVYNRLNDGLVKYGVPHEKRRYSPHITIGRVKSAAHGVGLVEMMGKYLDSEFGEVEVSELVFMMSELTGDGPIYTPLSHIPFGAH